MGNTDPVMEKFNASIAYDQRMWDADIRGSKAYVKALEKAKLVTTEEMNHILHGMQQVNLCITSIQRVSGPLVSTGLLDCGVLSKNKQNILFLCSKTLNDTTISTTLYTLGLWS